MIVLSPGQAGFLTLGLALTLALIGFLTAIAWVPLVDVLTVRRSYVAKLGVVPPFELIEINGTSSHHHRKRSTSWQIGGSVHRSQIVFVGKDNNAHGPFEAKPYVLGRLSSSKNPSGVADFIDGSTRLFQVRIGA